MAKYIFVTGGVVSSLGKGICAASLGCLLESRGLKVACQKFDPYLNVDPGTMSPFQHGEVFVTDDGAETDLDLGHYERFTHSKLTQSNNVTSGRIYEQIIARERRGDYLGKTVQVIPHVTNEIKAAMKRVAQDVDVVIVEIGGTVGDIESLPFLEAIRQMRHEQGRANCIFLHVTLVPYIAAAGEMKTKPTQHSVKELRALGIQPDILVCRSERFIPQEMKEKIALFCDVDVEAVVTGRDVKSVYEVPVTFAAEGVDEIVLRLLKIDAPPRNLGRWTEMLERLQNPRDEVTIGLVGKYVEYEDSYKSLKEALLHGGLAHQLKVNIRWIVAEGVVGPGWERRLEGYDGILVPGGFGERGIEGMINSIRYARENQVPYFGICLGMQTMVIEYARNVCGLAGAHSTEFDPGTAAPRHLQTARVEGRRRTGRHHAPGQLALPPGGEQLRRPRLRNPRDPRAPPPSLRVQPRVRGAPQGRRPAHHRRDPRQHLRRDLRNRRPSLVPGLPVPPRVQEQTHGTAPALQGIHRRRLPAAPPADGSRRADGAAIHPWRLSSAASDTARRWR